MEFRRAKLEETPDADLVARHEREIFPLLHRRELFAESADFALYDFVTADGAVNEDVFAYSNRRGDARSLVVYHNKYAETRGWIRTAAVTGRSLAQGLGVSGGADDHLVLRDWRSGLEYLRNQRELAEHGLYLELRAYECQTYGELRDLHDSDGRWGRLAAWLGGRGVPSLDDALREMELAPLHAALRADDAAAALREAAALLGVEAKVAPAVAAKSSSKAFKTGRAVDAVEGLVARVRPALAGGRWITEWLADRVLSEPDLVAVALERRRRPKTAEADGALPAWLLRDERFRRAIGVNAHEGVEWFNKERWAQALDRLAVPATQRRRLASAAEKAGYRLDRLAAQLEKPPRRTKGATAAAKPGAKSRAVPAAKPRATPSAKPRATPSTLPERQSK
jgi:hypothetical protein